jgi:hypothetical protein
MPSHAVLPGQLLGAVGELTHGLPLGEDRRTAARSIPDDRVVCPDERYGSGPVTVVTRHGRVPSK